MSVLEQVLALDGIWTRDFQMVIKRIMAEPKELLQEVYLTTYKKDSGVSKNLLWTVIWCNWASHFKLGNFALS